MMLQTLFLTASLAASPVASDFWRQSAAFGTDGSDIATRHGQGFWIGEAIYEGKGEFAYAWQQSFPDLNSVVFDAEAEAAISAPGGEAEATAEHERWFILKRPASYTLDYEWAAHADQPAAVIVLENQAGDVFRIEGVIGSDAQTIRGELPPGVYHLRCACDVNTSGGVEDADLYLEFQWIEETPR